MFGKDSKKKELIANLGEIYQKIEKEHQISPGDFPNLAKMQVREKKKCGSKQRVHSHQPCLVHINTTLIRLPRTFDWGGVDVQSNSGLSKNLSQFT